MHWKKKNDKRLLGKLEMAKFKVGRSAVTGKFMTVNRARAHKRTVIVETIKTSNKNK
jgi:hypothetical protein